MSADNGGPAFPRVVHEGDSYDNGMDLRDYFAAHVQIPRAEDIGGRMQRDLAGRDYPTGDDSLLDRIQWELDWRAAYKLRIADAMIRARAT